MTHQAINLHEIDFSQPDGYIVFQEQTCRVKQYLKNTFLSISQINIQTSFTHLNICLQQENNNARTFGTDLKITLSQSDYCINGAIAAIKAIARVTLLCGCNKKVARIRNDEFSIHYSYFIFLSSF